MQIDRRFALGCLFMLAAGCQRQGAEAPAADAGPTAAAPAAASFLVTINNVTRTQRIQRSRLDVQEAPSGESYVVLDVTVANPGTQTRVFSAGPLIAVDGARQRRIDAPENILADGYLLLETLAPGASERGRVVYAVPENLSGNLYWQPMGGKRMLVQADASPAANAGRTLAQAEDEGTDADAGADIPQGGDATDTVDASPAVADPGPAPRQHTASGATSTQAPAIDAIADDARAAGSDVASAPQLRELACRALVRDNRRADKARYLGFFHAQCQGMALPSAWTDAAVAARKADATMAPAPRPPAPAAGSPGADAQAPEPKAPVARDDGGPSFDCSRAVTRAEQLVCQDALLSLLDRQLAQAYTSARREVADPVALQRDEDDWRRRVRDACMSLDCLESAYTRRTAALRAAGGFVDSD